MENLTKRKQSSVENAKREAKDMRIESRKDERSAKKSERSMVLINNLYEDIHMEFQNLQLQVFFFCWGGGGCEVSHNCSCSFEDESKVGRATKQPCSKKMVLFLGLFTRWEESETGSYCKWQTKVFYFLRVNETSLILVEYFYSGYTYCVRGS